KRSDHHNHRLWGRSTPNRGKVRCSARFRRFSFGLRSARAPRVRSDRSPRLSSNGLSKPMNPLASPGVSAALFVYAMGLVAATLLAPLLAVQMTLLLAGLIVLSVGLLEPMLVLLVLVVGTTLVSKDRVLFHAGLGWTPDRLTLLWLVAGL